MNQNHRMPIWHLQFDSWAGAAKEAESRNQQSTTAGFESDRWFARQRDLLMDARGRRMPRPTSLPLIAALKQPQTITDWGAGSGWAFPLVDEAWAGVTSYRMIETAESVESFQQEWEGDRRATYSTLSSAIRLDTATDLVYSNSTLQYLPTNDVLLDIIGTEHPRLILIDDWQQSSDRIFTLQHYYGTFIATRFGPASVLVAELARMGYRCACDWAYPTQLSDRVDPIGVDSTGEFLFRPEGARSLLFERD